MADVRKNARRESAALHLARGLTIRNAARSARVGERTLHRWLADPSFRRRVCKLRDEMSNRAAGRLAAGMVRAAEVLSRMLKSDSERARLAAAKVILAAGLQVGELVDLQARIAELEEMIHHEPRESHRFAGKHGAA